MLPPDSASDRPPLRFALFGAGFWSRYQLSGWRELTGVECVAVYDRRRDKAAALATEFGIERSYDDPMKLFAENPLDFADIVTAPYTHLSFIKQAADHGVDVISQKPLATSLADAESAVAYCREQGTRLFVHENFRWQTPILALKEIVASGAIGVPFRCRLEFSSAFPVFENQPSLKKVDQFILADVGSHIFDVARFLMGEVVSVACRTARIHRDIQGEDVATTLLTMESGAVTVCELSYATRLPTEVFPQTLARVEGVAGTVALLPEFILQVTTASGTTVRTVEPAHYPWADPAYDVAHASIVACHANLLAALRGAEAAGASGLENLSTMRIVFAAYESASRGSVVHVNQR